MAEEYPKPTLEAKPAPSTTAEFALSSMLRACQFAESVIAIP